jgi:hypothetical protein
MKYAFGLVVILMSLGAAPPQGRAPDPPPPRPVAPPPMPSVWQQIQPALDRSTGRIIDSTSYEVGRLNYMRDERLGLVPPLTQTEILRIERERQLRIDERNRRLNLATERARREEADLREYEMSLHTGLYAAAADEEALNAAKAARDAALIEADAQRSERVQAQPGNRAQIDTEWVQRTRQIRQDYEKRRATILGMDQIPTTQPAP